MAAAGVGERCRRRRGRGRKTRKRTVGEVRKKSSNITAFLLRVWPVSFLGFADNFTTSFRVEGTRTRWRRKVIMNGFPGRRNSRRSACDSRQEESQEQAQQTGAARGGGRGDEVEREEAGAATGIN